MQKDTLFDSRLCEREFGSHLLNVANLLEWAKSKGHYFPPTEPPIENYQFAQVEALLVAIERVFQALDEAQALNIVRSQQEHHHHAAVTNKDSRMAKWLLHADAHAKWHSLVATAVNHHELRLLDYASHLPISAEALRVLLASLPKVSQSSASDASQASDAQAAAGEVKVNADDLLDRSNEHSAARALNRKSRDSVGNRRLSNINATNKLGDREERLKFESIIEVKSRIVALDETFSNDSSFLNKFVQRERLSNLIGCDPQTKLIYKASTLPKLISEHKKEMNKLP